MTEPQKPRPGRRPPQQRRAIKQKKKKPHVQRGLPAAQRRMAQSFPGPHTALLRLLSCERDHSPRNRGKIRKFQIIYNHIYRPGHPPLFQPAPPIDGALPTKHRVSPPLGGSPGPKIPYKTPLPPSSEKSITFIAEAADMTQMVSCKNKNKKSKEDIKTPQKIKELKSECRAIIAGDKRKKWAKGCFAYGRSQGVRRRTAGQISKAAPRVGGSWTAGESGFDRPGFGRPCSVRPC